MEHDAEGRPLSGSSRLSAATAVAPARSAEHAVPICVDLDGTLSRTDTLVESVIALVRLHPLELLRLPFWLLHGRTRFKKELACRSKLNPRVLPFREELVDFLRRESDLGRPVVLATAANVVVAEHIAQHFGFFSEVIATDATNVKGKAKAQLLQSRFADKGFDYIGDSSADLPVWRACRKAYIAGKAVSAESLREQGIEVEASFVEGRSQWAALARSCRVHQWAKNVLVFVPIVLAHRLADASALSRTMAVFFAFCFAASAMYLINDALDVHSDRLHRSKRSRPMASGELPIGLGLVAAFALLVAAGAMAVRGGTSNAIPALAGYVAITTAYSFWIKKKPLLDAITLAGLYTLRVEVGSLASGAPISAWLLAFSVFAFFSLALAKRFAEITGENGESSSARGYRGGDVHVLSMMGVSSGYISVLVVALYVHSPDVAVLYARPQWLWCLCPLLLYWLSRIWLVAHRGVLHEDPVVFALTDRSSILAGLVAILIIALAHS